MRSAGADGDGEGGPTTLLRAHANIIPLSEARRAREQQAAARVQFVGWRATSPPSHPAAQALLAGIMQGIGERANDGPLFDAGKRLAEVARKASAKVRVLVCGGRDFCDRDRLAATLDRLHQERGFALVIAGGARGADTLAEEWATARGIACDVYRADWVLLGRKAGPIRNSRMLTEGKPQVVVAFPGGRGTAHMTRIAREAGVEVVEILPSRF
jgi:hypothetical protein